MSGCREAIAVDNSGMGDSGTDVGAELLLTEHCHFLQNIYFNMEMKIF